MFPPVGYGNNSGIIHVLFRIVPFQHKIGFAIVTVVRLVSANCILCWRNAR
jgi:hypothetical protein